MQVRASERKWEGAGEGERGLRGDWNHVFGGGGCEGEAAGGARGGKTILKVLLPSLAQGDCHPAPQEGPGQPSAVEWEGWQQGRPLRGPLLSFRQVKAPNP